MQFLKTQIISQLYVILTEQCNSCCRGCTYWSDGKDYIDPEFIKRVIVDLKQYQLKQVMFTGGEPLLHPNFKSILKFTHNTGIKTKVVTNGVLLKNYSDTVFQWIDLWTISIDALDSKIYKSVRGIDAYSIVLSSINRLLKLGKNVKLSFLIQRHNYDQLADFIEFALKIKVDSISILLPDFRGTFGPRKQKNSNIPEFLLLPEQIEYLENYEFPRIRRIIRREKKELFINFQLENFDLIIDYLRWILIEKDPPILRYNRCLNPYNSLTIFPSGSLSLCFYFPEHFNINSPNNLIDPNSNDLCKLRGQYYFEQTHFKERCRSCLQVPISNEG